MNKFNEEFDNEILVIFENKNNYFIVAMFLNLKIRFENHSFLPVNVSFAKY